MQDADPPLRGLWSEGAPVEASLTRTFGGVIVFIVLDFYQYGVFRGGTGAFGVFQLSTTGVLEGILAGDLGSSYVLF